MKPLTAKRPLAGSSRAARVARLATVAVVSLGANLALAQSQVTPPHGGGQAVAAAAPATGAAQTPAGAATRRADDAATQETTETEITARDGADFDAKGRAATFNGTVHVSDPRFELWCDRLTVFLNRETEKDPDAANDRPPPTNNAPASGGGIDRALAEGHVVIKQTRPATDGGEAKTSIGRSERAEFTNRTGEVVLSGGRPTIEQGMNILEATSSQTRIILTRENTLRTEGPSRTVIRQRSDAADKMIPGGGGRSATPAAAGAAAQTPKPRSTPARPQNR